VEVVVRPLALSLVAFGFICGGVLLGARLHFRLTDQHRNPDTKEAVRLGMALVGTMVALVLGLLIGSSKNFYDTQNSEVTEAAASIVLLDRVLVHYGEEARNARELLRNSVAAMVDGTGPRDGQKKSHFDPTVVSGERLLDKIQELTPRNDNQRLLQSQALGLAMKLGQTRWLMFEQKSSSVPMPLLAMLVFWLTLLFTSFGLFVRPNTMLVCCLLTSALAVSGAILMILEMYDPYTGLIHVSEAPLRAALAQLGQ
jgi:hypothetical protein